MKRVLISVALLCGLSCSAAAQNPAAALMPMPNSIEVAADDAAELSLAEIASLSGGVDRNSPAMRELRRVILGRVGADIFAPTGSGAAVTVTLDPALTASPEQYTITSTPGLLVIAGATEEALFRAAQTLDQIFLGDAVRTSRKAMAQLTIADAPRTERRALMLDPARHFLPVEDVKLYIDEMAHYKYNVLQLHLTDDEGWRVQIKSHPELTAGGPFYTQSQLRDLIAYAADHYIEIVPELDVPGHTTAVLTSHPELACAITDSVALAAAKGNGRMLCASQEGVYRLYNDILREVAALFPSPYIHLGGDEAAVERNWALCDRDRRLARKHGYSKPSDLMNLFFGRILASVRAAGKRPILWCELDNIRMPANEYLFPYPEDVVLVTWRMGLTPKCQELTAASGHTLIMAPGEYAYFDYPQYRNDLPEHNNWGMPTTTLQRAYEFDPSSAPNVQGVMGTLWGEAIADINRANYMTYPRALALAEAGWTLPASRSWDSFRRRLPAILADMLTRGISFRAPFEIYR